VCVCVCVREREREREREGEREKERGGGGGGRHRRPLEGVLIDTFAQRRKLVPLLSYTHANGRYSHMVDLN
jgi:hypothetical protein